ncbi:MAG: hypothetical protein ACWA5Q_02945 [bacterium]
MTSSEEYSGRRKKKLINKKFQNRYMLTMVLAAVVVLNFGIVLFSVLFGFEGVGTKNGIKPVTLVIVELLTLAIVWYLTLGQSHKIAGPIFVFERSLRSVSDGDLTLDIRLREGDQFHETAHLFNTCVGSLRNHIAEIQRSAQALAEDLEEGSPQAEKAKDLQSKLDWFKTESKGGA